MGQNASPANQAAPALHQLLPLAQLVVLSVDCVRRCRYYMLACIFPQGLPRSNSSNIKARRGVSEQNLGSLVSCPLALRDPAGTKERGADLQHVNGLCFAGNGQWAREEFPSAMAML